MADQKFPTTLYNADGATLQVNTPDEFAKAKQKGYKPGYVKTHFPKCLYKIADGSTLTVADEAALSAALNSGAYTEDYVAPPAANTGSTAAGSGGGGADALSRTLLAENHELKSRLEDLEARVEDLETAAAKATKAATATKPAKAETAKA